MASYSVKRRLLRFAVGKPQVSAHSTLTSRNKNQRMLEGLRDAVQLKDIPTIGQLYRQQRLTQPSVSQALYEPNMSALEKVSLYQGDITKLWVDAIVNAANKSLLGGGGGGVDLLRFCLTSTQVFVETVDGAIHLAAGPRLREECFTLNGCRTGESKITRGYELPARHIIHTVGPEYSPEKLDLCARKLASCYKTSLMVGVENEVRHIAFPCVSTGVYRYPAEDAAQIALEVVREFLDSEVGQKLERIIFVVWNPRDREVYESFIPKYFPPAPPKEM